jgi:coatomer subunit beta'
MEFVWSSDSNDYAIREGGARIKIHKNFQEKATLKIEYAVEGIHGGALVGEWTLISTIWLYTCEHQ